MEFIAVKLDKEYILDALYNNKYNEIGEYIGREYIQHNESGKITEDCVRILFDELMQIYLNNTEKIRASVNDIINDEERLKNIMIKMVSGFYKNSLKQENTTELLKWIVICCNMEFGEYFTGEKSQLLKYILNEAYSAINAVNYDDVIRNNINLGIYAGYIYLADEFGI